VLSIEPVSNTGVVGTRDELAVRHSAGIRPTFMERAVPGRWRGEVQVRAHGASMPAWITFTDHSLVVELDDACVGIAPGQACVAYDGDRVVGSATISEAR